MQIEIATLADAATADVTGKLNILGIFDTFYAKNFPAIHPQCTFAVKLRIDQNDNMSRPLIISFIDEQDKELQKPIELPLPITLQKKDAINLIINLNNIKLPQPGTYRITLSNAGNLLKELTFFVKKPVPKEG